jgi:hypothetical protein
MKDRKIQLVIGDIDAPPQRPGGFTETEIADLTRVSQRLGRSAQDSSRIISHRCTGTATSDRGV